MSSLQIQAIKSIMAMPDDKLTLLLESIQHLVAPEERAAVITHRDSDPAKKSGGIKLGLFNGVKYIAEGHDIDECNDEIAELFGVDDL